MAYLSCDLSDKLNDEHIETLNKANIWTINDFCSTDLMEIRRRTNIRYSSLRDIGEKIKQRYTLPCNDFNYILEKSIIQSKMCPTGLPELTLALDGGFQTQEIVEFFGDTECGKTEMCYLLCGEILSHFDEYQIMFIASSCDVDHEKIAKYTKLKAGNREMSEDDIFKCLSRVEIARSTRLADLVHLLNTLVHSDKKNSTKCVIVDSLSFIIQEDILEIKTCNLTDGDEISKFSALLGYNAETRRNSSSSTAAPLDGPRKDLIEIYLHEVMRLLTSIAITKNVILVITNSDQQLARNKAWTNAVDHRIHLSRMSEFSRFHLQNPQSTVCRATILKTIHNISRLGYSIPFAINNEGLFAIRINLSISTKNESEDDEDEDKNSGDG